MAVLTPVELAELRREVSRGEGSVPWDKVTVNAALQAIEDSFEASRAGMQTALDNASAPFAFGPALKGKLLAAWLRQKSRREEQA